MGRIYRVAFFTPIVGVATFLGGTVVGPNFEFPFSEGEVPHSSAQSLGRIGVSGQVFSNEALPAIYGPINDLRLVASAVIFTALSAGAYQMKKRICNPVSERDMPEGLTVRERAEDIYDSLRMGVYGIRRAIDRFRGTRSTSEDVVTEEALLDIDAA